jgi:hypothetical protein
VRWNEAKNLLKIKHITSPKAAHHARFERRFAQFEPEKSAFCTKRTETHESKGEA